MVSKQVFWRVDNTCLDYDPTLLGSEPILEQAPIKIFMHKQHKQPTPLPNYVKKVKRLAEEIGINKKMLDETFREEMKSAS